SAAECVVDVLEMIEVKGNHREPAPPARLKMLQLFQQATPVDQAGEVVAVSLADELVLRSFALADVLIGTEDGDDPAAGIVQPYRRDGDLHHVPVTVTAPRLDLEHIVASRGSLAQPVALPAGSEFDEM